MKQSCRTCLHYDLESTKSRTGRVMSYGVAKCKWDDVIVVPSSMRGVFGRFQTSYMQPIDGTDCPCWVRVPKEAV